FRVGLFVHAEEQTQAAAFEVFGDGFVCREHELFDDAVGDVALAAEDAGHASSGVPFEHAEDVGVGHALGGVDDAGHKFGAYRGAVRVHFEERAHHQAVHMRVQ